MLSEIKNLVITASGAGTFESDAFKPSKYRQFSTQVTWSGAASGVLDLICSNNGVNFVKEDVPVTVVGASGSEMIHVQERLNTQYGKFEFVSTSGVTDIDIVINGLIKG